MKPALLVVFVVVAVISGESAKYSYHHSTTGACARVRAGADEAGGRGRRGERGEGKGGRGAIPA